MMKNAAPDVFKKKKKNQTLQNQKPHSTKKHQENLCVITILVWLKLKILFES